MIKNTLANSHRGKHRGKINVLAFSVLGTLLLVVAATTYISSMRTSNPLAYCHLMVGLYNAGFLGDGESVVQPDDTVDVVASIETQETPDSCEGADDPAIWFDASNPKNSLIVVSHKMRGVGIQKLDGSTTQALEPGPTNNVDLVANVFGSDALVAGTNRATQTIDLYRLDGISQTLVKLDGSEIPWPVEGNIGGVCFYRSPNDEKLYVFSNDETGLVVQFELYAENSNRVSHNQVREFNIDTANESCSVDHGNSWFYISAEDQGLWRYPAEPHENPEKYVVDATGANKGSGGHLTSDVEGTAIYEDPNGSPEDGYLVVSSQGNFTYVIYDRIEPYNYRGTFRLVDGDGIDGTSDTDGLEVSSAPFPGFPKGILVVQDGSNTNSDGSESNQNYKIVDWRRIEQALALAP